MNILAIDLGSKTGVCFMRDSQVCRVETWNLEGDTDAALFCDLNDTLESAIVYEAPEAVAYEEVASHKGTRAAHIYGGLRAVLLMACVHHEVQCLSYSVGTIKKYATGKGNADKDAMLLAAERRWPGVVTNNNEADALWIGALACKELGDGNSD